MNRIILTGATGFVGKNLIEHFKRTDLEIVYQLNLRKDLPKELPDSDVMIHLAGKAHDLKSVSNHNEYFEINYGKTKELFDLFLKSQCNDFIYFSSVKAVADTVEGTLTETVYPDPQTPYGKSKLRAEEYLLSHVLSNGKRLFILRPCMIHGPGNKGNLNLLYKIVKKRIPFPLGAFDNKRSFLSIDNLLFVLERIIKDRSISGGVFNIADDEAISTNELMRVIAEGTRVKGRIWNVNKRLILNLAKFGDVFHLPLSSERLKKLTENYVVSNDKIKNALNIDNLPHSTREGLINTIHSFEN